MWGLLWLAACQPPKDSAAPPPLDTSAHDTGDGCGETAPTITDLWLENAGLEDNEQGEPTPTLSVHAVTDDPDGDLHQHTVDLWWDDVADGSVAQDPERHETDPSTVETDLPCSILNTTARMRVFVSDARFDYSTAYEWAVTVTDANGHASEVAITTATTPAADGS